MSVSVALEELHAQVAQLARAPYLVTVSGDGHPHLVAVRPSWRGDDLVTAVGKTTAANGRERTGVCFVWPANEPDGYSLIVDGTVVESTSAEGSHEVVVRPDRATLHRPAPAGDGYAPDCVRVLKR